MVTEHHPDVILLDLAMPNMDGFELMVHLQENPQTCSIPIIVSSASVFELVDDNPNNLKVLSDPEIEELVEEIDLEYLVEDLPKILGSMHQGIGRLKDISLSLRTFARSDISSTVEFQIHEGIDSTLMLLKHRLQDQGSRPKIEVIKEYGNLPSNFVNLRE